MANEETKNKEAPKTATAENQAPQQDPMALSIGDLKNLQGILDVASKRGAFGASEMAPIGALWNKIAQYLQSKNITPAKTKDKSKEKNNENI